MIVLDANILIRAVLGRRVRQLIETYGVRGARFFAPEVAFDDAASYLPPLLKKRDKQDVDVPAALEYLRTSSSRLTARSTASLKARRGSACVVATKTIGQCWLRRWGWHVPYGRKMQTSSELVSRHGQQIASRFF